MARAFRIFSSCICFVVIVLNRGALAHPGALDSLGCHIDEITGNYHCHQGPLEGREFISKEIAEDALQAMKAQTDADQVEELQVSTMKNGKRSEGIDEGGPDLRLVTWNARHFGKEGFDYDRAAILAGESDLIVFQDLRFAAGGTDPLQILADVMRQRYSREYCKAWLKIPGGLRHAFLWREDRIGYVMGKGEIRENCDNAVIRFEAKKELALATFYAKGQKRMFSVVSFHLDQKPKNFDREVLPAFKALMNQSWPVFVTGNIQLSATDKSFKKVKDAKFNAVVARNGKGAKDNLWFKDAGLIGAIAHKTSEVEPALGDQAPVEAAFSFTKMNPEKEEASIRTVKRGKRGETGKVRVAKSKAKEMAKPDPAGKEKYEVYIDGGVKPMDTREDLHEELNEADKAVGE